MKIRGAAVAAAAATLMLAGAAEAAGERDLQVIGRALSFVEGGPSGSVVLAIVYSDDAPGSKEEADATAAAIGGGLAAGEVTLTAQVVPVSALASASGAAAVFVPAGMAAHYDAIKASGKISFSTDRACVTAGGCVVAIQSAPKVEIVVNRAAAAAASVSFESAFQMMINEI